MAEKQFILDGSTFDSLESFYNEVGKVLCPGFKWGRNLDAFNDILRGGFGAFEYEESIDLVWKHSEKSKADLKNSKEVRGQAVFNVLIEIIQENTHVNLILE